MTENKEKMRMPGQDLPVARVNLKALREALAGANLQLSSILDALQGVKPGLGPIDPLAHGSTNTGCTNTSCLTPGMEEMVEIREQ
jgi:hypothetical protein